MSFKDQNTAYTYEVGSSPDATYKTAENDDADLGNFFGRPVKIADFAWSTSIPDFYENFDPWDRFFRNPRVVNRISNFNNLRCKLHVRFLINGNGFHYGRLLASYSPLATVDDFLVDRGLSRLDNVAASQRPHIYLDPTNSQGGDMILPFFWPDNYLNIPLQEWQRMGRISIRTLQNLKHANGASDISRISVFAWAEEVTLSIPTSTEPGTLEPQSGEDEYGKGPISRPASIVARVMGKLTNVPYIGSYARATEIAANAVDGAATAFGYSRPNDISNIQPYRPAVMGNLANTNVPDSAVKLSMDCKQELTVDPTTVGLSSTDEMTLCSIAGRESWLTSFTWSPDSSLNPPETALFAAQVTPLIWASQNFGGVDEVHMPACCFAALPFVNWRGSMKYRFQIVASNYHKGRLKVVYDPFLFSTNEYNTNYTHIIDIAEEKDFTIEIGWGSSLPFLDVSPPLSWQFPRFGTAPSPFPLLSGANGTIAVYVVNDLTVPSASSVADTIEINVFVSAGDDMTFRDPTADLDRYNWFPEPQSGVELIPQSGEESMTQMDKEDTEEPSRPMQQTIEKKMAETVSQTDATDHVFFGESLVSIRSMLKRYNRHSSYINIDEAGLRIARNVFSSFPFYSGYASNAVTPVNGGAEQYNFSHMTYLNYFTPAFKGWRGGMRWKLNPTVQSTGRYATHNVSRQSGVVSAYEESSVILPTDPAELNRLLAIETMPMLGGGHASNSAANPCLEIEVPYQKRLRFSNARSANYTAPTASITTINDTVNLRYETILSGNRNQSALIVEKFVGTGEDFSLFFFVGCPIMYPDVTVPLL